MICGLLSTTEEPAFGVLRAAVLITDAYTQLCFSSVDPQAASSGLCKTLI
jgi:hypothetical protein